MNIAIVGAGKLGRRVALALMGGDYDVTIIDKNEEKLQSLYEQSDWDDDIFLLQVFY